jgi:hypothetical protein
VVTKGGRGDGAKETGHPRGGPPITGITGLIAESGTNILFELFS